MKKCFLFTSLLLSLLICGCANNSTSGSGNNKPDEHDHIPDDDSGDELEGYVYISEGRRINIEQGKKKSLTVNSNPTDLMSDYETLSWSNSNESVASVSQYGVLNALSVGETVISFSVTLPNGETYKTSSLVNVYAQGTSLTREYQKVDDLDSLASGDVIVFACPEASVAANLTRSDKSLGFSQTTFSSDYSKITSLGEGVGEYIISGENIQTDEGEVEVFTLESQEGKYLAAKNYDNITFVNTKGNILWGFENINGRSYVYNTNPSFESWLMFNTKYNKFTLYDSNEQIDMFLPTIYRLTTVY